MHGMKIPARHEGSQNQFRALPIFSNFVEEDHGILPVDHRQRFLKDNGADAIGPNGQGIEPEPDQILKPAGMDNTGILVAGEIVARIAENNPFFEAVDEHHASDGRVRGGDEQAVIAPGVAADERGGRKPPKAVCLKPFFGKRRVEVGAGVLVEGDHLRESLQNFSVGVTRQKKSGPPKGMRPALMVCSAEVSPLERHEPVSADGVLIAHSRSVTSHEGRLVRPVMPEFERRVPMLAASMVLCVKVNSWTV